MSEATKIRVLPTAEFGRLKELGDGFTPDPSNSVVLVAEQGGKLVGRIFLMTPTHLEGPFIVPESRNGMIAAGLEKAATGIAKDAGVTRMFAYGTNREIESYLARLGYVQSPLTVWTKELR